MFTHTLAVRSRLRTVALFAFLITWGSLSIGLAQNWMISGTVSSSLGGPLAGIDIDMFPAGDTNELTLSQDFTSVTGAFNLLIVDAIPAGFYDIVFRPAAGTGLFTEVRPNVFIAGNQNIGAVVVTAGIYVGGQVIDATGTGLFGVDLDAFDSQGNTVDLPEGGTTDAAGLFSTLLVPGTYTLEFKATAATSGGPFVPVRRLDVQAATSITLPDVVFHLGYPLTGTVLNNLGQALVNADVDITDLVTRERIFTPGDNTGATGSFQVLVPDGVWEVQIDPPPGQQLVPFLGQASVSPTPPNDVGVVVLPPGFLVSGLVIQGGGVPVPNVDLDFIVTATQVEVPVANDNANPAGVFSAVVAPGTYDIAFRPDFALGLAPKVLPAVTINANTALGSVVLDLGFALSGVVTNAGVPVPGVTVALSQAGTGVPVYVFGNLTNAAGAYALRVVPGTYDALFTPPVGSGLPNVSMTGVVMSGAVTRNVDFAVSATPSVMSLACMDSGSDAILTWTNGASDYDSIRVLRNGSLIAQLGGTATGFTDLSLLDGLYSFSVIATRSGIDSTPANCQVAIATGPPGIFIRGDATGDGSVNIADAIAALNYLFGGGAVACLDAGDANDDGSINISDPIFLLAFLFSGGATPAPPFPGSGADPTTDPLSCP